MGGKSNISSFNELHSARHLVTNSKHHDGFEAPRNSLELPMESANRHQIINDSLMMKQQFPEMNFKMSTDEEVTNREYIKRGGPSVVARLMGVDTLPTEKKQTTNMKESFEEIPRKHVSRVPRFVSVQSELNALSSTTFTQSKEEMPSKSNKQNSRPSTKNTSSIKPHRREHPQEELLQKFKKEFESWQASKLSECSSILDQNDGIQGLKNEQILACESLNMEKMVKYTNAHRYSSAGKTKMAPNQTDGFYNDANVGTQSAPKMKEDMTIRRKLAANSFEAVPKAKAQEKRSRSCSPTRIVILKPSSDINEMEPSEALPKGNNMEHFLEEVKERLRMEMEGKGRSDSVRRGNVGHTLLHERSSDSKKLARDIAKHIKESVNKDNVATLARSESSKSYKNDFHVNEPALPESLKKDTRKFISDRLKNVLKDEIELEKPLFNDGRMGNSSMIKGKKISESIADDSKNGKGTRFWETKKAVNESIPKYIRREHAKMSEFDTEIMSPPQIIRSFSAPASGTPFGKLLLEDHHVGTQICRMHETSETNSAVFDKSKKDGFNFKGRVSNLRRNLSFKGKIFGKKMPLIEESTSDAFSYVKPIETMPSLIRNFGLVEDNSTEVPPSPASFSSSPINERHSPVSPLESPFVEDHSSVQVSGELCVALQDPAIQSLQTEIKASETLANEAQLNGINETMHIESHAKSYVRDILLVSGLFEASPFDQALSWLDSRAVTISSRIFEEVEEKNYECKKLEGGFCKLGDTNIDRKVLFDLVNEVLPIVLCSHVTPLTSKRWKESLMEFPRGNKLLDDLFDVLQMHVNSNVDRPHSVEKLVAWDVKLRPWSTSSYEDIGFVEGELEAVIIGELIDELVSDFSVRDVAMTT